MSTEPTHDTSASRPAKRKIPPLVWIVAAIFVGWLAIFLVQRDGVVESPSGGTHPAAAEGEAINPATPATPETPGTPQTSTAY